MADNRTTELLCKLLDERGEDYTRNDFGITWSYYSDPHTATESMDGTLIVTGLTPEQAIAATLGSEHTAHDTLTAEKVRHISEVIEKHWHDLPDEYDMPEATALPEYSYDWQAIADELNAELGSGTCELHDCDGSFSAVNRPVWRCDCGAFMTQYTDATTYHKPRFCPNCGARIRKAVER